MLLLSKFFQMEVQDLKIEEKWTLVEHSLKKKKQKKITKNFEGLPSNSFVQELEDQNPTKKNKQNVSKRFIKLKTKKKNIRNFKVLPSKFHTGSHPVVIDLKKTNETKC
jgi:hypothetical protein